MNIPIAHDIEIDREARRVLKGGRDVQLTGLEFGLLDYLASHPNKVCTRDDILDHVWGLRFGYNRRSFECPPTQAGMEQQTAH